MSRHARPTPWHWSHQKCARQQPALHHLLAVLARPPAPSSPASSCKVLFCCSDYHFYWLARSNQHMTYRSGQYYAKCICKKAHRILLYQEERCYNKFIAPWRDILMHSKVYSSTTNFSRRGDLMSAIIAVALF